MTTGILTDFTSKGATSQDTVNTSGLSFTLTSSTYAAITGLSASITPRTIDSKVLVCVTVDLAATAGVHAGAGIQVFRDSTQIALAGTVGSRIPIAAFRYLFNTSNMHNSMTFYFLDSPSTISALAYTAKVGGDSTSSGNVHVNRSATDTDSNVNFKASSSIVLLEI